MLKLPNRMQISIADASVLPFESLKHRPLHLIFDVDGVVRHHTEMPIDERVLKSFKELVKHTNIKTTFISGTPVAQRNGLELWRKSNSTLDSSIGEQFKEELATKRIAIFGALGGQKLDSNLNKVVLEEYTLGQIFEIGKMLISAFILEVENDGNENHKKAAKFVLEKLKDLDLRNHAQHADETPEEFKELIEYIRESIDPHFKLISYGSFIESHTSHPAWHSHHSVNYLKKAVNDPDCGLFSLEEEEKHVGHGIAYRKVEGFNFLMISKTNKGRALKRILSEQTNNAEFLITFGDTQVDFPMHELADLSFHLGKRKIWEHHNLPHCHLVVDKDGKDEQHVDGTLFLLHQLQVSRG